MLVNILSLTKTIYQGEADSLTAPGIKGRLTILPHHTPLIALLKKGSLILEKNGKKSFFEIEKGILEVNFSEINVLVNLSNN